MPHPHPHPHPDRIADIAARLDEAGQHTAALFRSLDAEALNVPLYGEGDSPWRARDLLAHFVTIERSMHDSDLDRQGRHPFHGAGTLGRFVRWPYEHAALHEAELQAALAHPRNEAT